MATVPLPAKASLSQLRARAKELRKAVAKGRPDAVQRARAHHPAYDEASFTLRDAQLTIARENGLASWPELMDKVATELVEGRELHRYFGGSRSGSGGSTSVCSTRGGASSWWRRTASR